MMKLLFLMRKTCTRHFKGELLIMIQIFIAVVLLNTSLIPFVKYWQLHNWIADGVPSNMVYYSAPTFALLDSQNSVDYISQLYADDRIAAICLTYHTIGYINGEKADIYLYSPEVFTTLNSILASGNWAFQEHTVFVNKGVRANLGDAATYKITVHDKLFDLDIECTSAGIINPHDIVYDLKSAGSQPEYSEIGLDYSQLRHLVPSRSQLLAIVPFDIIKHHASCEMIGGTVAKLEEGISPAAFVESFNASNLSGKMFLLSALEENSMKRLIGLYRFDALVCILVFVSALFGIGGDTYLRLGELKKHMGIYIFCGCSFRLYSRLILTLDLICLAIPTVFAYFVRDVLVLSEGYDSFWSFAIACSFVITVAIVPFVLTIHSSRKLSLMQLIYYGD